MRHDSFTQEEYLKQQEALDQLLQIEQAKLRIDLEMEKAKYTVAQPITTTVELPDGNLLTIKMNTDQIMAANGRDIDSIFWAIPCQNGGNTAPRNLRQVQDCKCIVCQAACATILKWKMLR